MHVADLVLSKDIQVSPIQLEYYSVACRGLHQEVHDRDPLLNAGLACRPFVIVHYEIGLRNWIAKG